MKKIKLIFAISVGIIIICSSCKSSQGHCDAYGNKAASSDTLDFDIYSSHNSSMSKYVSTSIIK